MQYIHKNGDSDPFQHVKVDVGEMLGDAGALSLGKPAVTFGEGFRIVSELTFGGISGIWQ